MDMLTYSYKPRVHMMALGVLFFGACAVFGFTEAQNETRDILIDGLIFLHGRTAYLFRWGIAFVAAIMSLLGVFGVVRGLTSRQTLVLDSTALRMPKWGFGDSVLTIPYETITGMHLMQVRNQHFLIIRHNRGKVSISRSMLPRKEDFDRVCAVLSERAAAVLMY